jgi:hypothetical protein
MALNAADVLEDMCLAHGLSLSQHHACEPEEQPP